MLPVTRQFCRSQLLAPLFAWQLFADGSLARAKLLSRLASSLAASHSRPQLRPANVVQLGDHVREALSNGLPVVALESTVITHGLPEPQNLELALGLEHEIRSGAWFNSVEPSEQCAKLKIERVSSPMAGQVEAATVGIVRGQLVVGLSRDQLEFLARASASHPIKCSRRDIPLARALRLSAGTTVSGTMAIVGLLGAGARSLRVFATGGLGGVHLDGHNSMDISADLHELGRCAAAPLGVVSSGFKSFLDTRRSLELLETLGVTVASLPQSAGLYLANGRDKSQLDEQIIKPNERRSHIFPGFFSAHNKEQVKSPWRCSDVCEAARVLAHCLGPAHVDCGERSQKADERHRFGHHMLLACPIPSHFSLDDQQQQQQQQRNEGHHCQLEQTYESALENISNSIDKRLDLNGYEKTPLILDELNRCTGGKTMQANLALLRNNARIGAHLAHELAQMLDSACRSPAQVDARPTTTTISTNNTHNHAEPVAACELERQASGFCAPTEHHAPVVIGCTMIDMHVKTKIDHKFRSNPRHSGITFAGEPHLSLGGVGRNLAQALELLCHAPAFVTALADDNLARFARAEFETSFNSSRVHILSSRAASSSFALLLIDSLTGHCEYVVANTEATKAISSRALQELSATINGEQERQRKRTAKPLLWAHETLARAPLLVMDANLAPSTLVYLIEFCHTHKVPIFLEPTDVECLANLVASLRLVGGKKSANSLAYMSPNVIELVAMLELFSGQNLGPTRGERSLEEVERISRELLDNYLTQLSCLLVTMDRRGVLLALRVPEGGVASNFGLAQLKANMGEQQNQKLHQKTLLVFKHFQPEQLVQSPISASGAGDCFASGFISGLLDSLSLEQCVRRAFKASLVALNSMETVPSELKQLALAREHYK